MSNELTPLKCGACGAVLSFQMDKCMYCGAALNISTESVPDTSPGGIDRKVLETIKKDGLLAAVKFYKDNSGKGLKESKDYVEDLAKKNGVEVPKGCFIATACYGNYNAPEVMVLRRFRDERLSNSMAGLRFIRLYYSVSPSIAQLLDRSGFLRSLVRKGFIHPLVKLLKKK